MRAFAVRSFGEAPAILDLPIPAADGALLIRVSYAGVNPLDYKLIDGLTPKSTFPFVVGVDFAGVVESVPPGERNFHPGDRIFGMAAHGAYTEYITFPPGAQTEPLARIPDGVTDEQAAALPVSALTALGSLELLRVATGQRLVVMGATGGVGGYAVQMAGVRGAHVLATVRGDADEARRLGAEEVYDTKAVDVIDAIHAAHPDGVDAVLDLVNGAKAIGRDAEVLKAGGGVLSTIRAADEKWFAGRQITAYNINAKLNPAETSLGLDQVARMLADGKITARISTTVELDGAAEILDKLRHGGVKGKAVIHVQG
jgi:NADPH2:quinone reductase